MSEQYIVYPVMQAADIRLLRFVVGLAGNDARQGEAVSILAVGIADDEYNQSVHFAEAGAAIRRGEPVARFPDDTEEKE